jgi:hypothetical protein
MTWKEVLSRHKTLRGIGRRSLLVDRGESGYRNQFLGGKILYPGEGLEGNQQPIKGNATLLRVLAERQAMRVYLRETANRWRDLGDYLVESVEYRQESQQRYVYWFTLVPYPQEPP